MAVYYLRQVTSSMSNRPRVMKLSKRVPFQNLYRTISWSWQQRWPKRICWTIFKLNTRRCFMVQRYVLVACTHIHTHTHTHQMTHAKWLSQNESNVRFCIALTYFMQTVDSEKKKLILKKSTFYFLFFRCAHASLYEAVSVGWSVCLSVTLSLKQRKTAEFTENRCSLRERTTKQGSG